MSSLGFCFTPASSRRLKYYFVFDKINQKTCYKVPFREYSLFYEAALILTGRYYTGCLWSETARQYRSCLAFTFAFTRIQYGHLIQIYGFYTTFLHSTINAWLPNPATRSGRPMLMIFMPLYWPIGNNLNI